jgi:hypothetical protein
MNFTFFLVRNGQITEVLSSGVLWGEDLSFLIPFFCHYATMFYRSKICSLTFRYRSLRLLLKTFDTVKHFSDTARQLRVLCDLQSCKMTIWWNLIFTIVFKYKHHVCQIKWQNTEVIYIAFMLLFVIW